jgi:hypothetical protein
MMPVALTVATVKAAIRDSRAGKCWEKADGLMPGLQFRAQPTGARWSVQTVSLPLMIDIIEKVGS